MSSVTLWGHDTVLGGKLEDEQVRVQVVAMKCSRPHILILRWQDRVFVIDQAHLNESKMHLPKKVSLRNIMEALKVEDGALPFSQADSLDNRQRVERVLRVLAVNHEKL